VELLDAGIAVADTARMLAVRFGCSARQARRYVARAEVGGRVEVPDTTVVFTVKVPAALAVRVREHARISGGSISALVVQALTEFLASAHTRPGRG
jgi:hypothetical protein